MTQPEQNRCAVIVFLSYVIRRVAAFSGILREEGQKLENSLRTFFRYVFFLTFKRKRLGSLRNQWLYLV